MLLLFLLFCKVVAQSITLPRCTSGHRCYPTRDLESTPIKPGCLSALSVGPLPYCVINGPVDSDYQVGYMGRCNSSIIYDDICVDCSTNKACSLVVIDPDNVHNSPDYDYYNIRVGGDILPDIYYVPQEFISNVYTTDVIPMPICECAQTFNGKYSLAYACYTPNQLYKSTGIDHDMEFINGSFCTPIPVDNFQAREGFIYNYNPSAEINEYLGSCNNGLLCYQLSNFVTPGGNGLCVVSYYGYDCYYDNIDILNTNFNMKKMMTKIREIQEKS